MGKPKLAFVDEVKSGDHRRALVALRDELAKSLAAAEPNVVAQIAGRLQAVLEAIAALPGEKKVSTTDELRARREGRRAAASAAAPAGGEGVKRRAGGGRSR